MFHNWIEKLEDLRFDQKEENLLLNSIEIYDNDHAIINKSDITLVFANEVNDLKIREELYRLQNHFNLRIIELGRIKKNNKEFHLPFFKELCLTNKVVFIGSADDYQDSIAKALNIPENGHKRLTISNTISDKNAESNIIAYQRHLSSSSALNKIGLFNLSLGELQKDLKRAEPIIRDTKYIQMNLSSLKYDCAFTKDAKITGLKIEEACALSRYAGLNAETQVFHLVIDSDQVYDQWFQTAALICWYLFEGLEHSIIEDVNDKNNQTFMVECEYTEDPVTFIKGHKTGRWWLKKPNVTEKSNQFFPCELADYNSFCSGIVPDKFMGIILE